MAKNNQPTASLSEVHESVDTTKQTGFWKKLFSFLGPAYLVSVGYMDPGNWATDIAGGSQFGYKLIWVLLMSNLMALLLQSLSARLGIVRGLDLAQASRATYPRWINLILYFLAEIAIAACDLAEVVGMAIGLQLLFGLPLLAGVAISVLDTFLILFLMNYGIRKIEAFILSLVAIIGLSFLAEMIIAKPVASEIALGFIPSLPGHGALYIAIGIIGATVMPHNLYLHSSLVQTRKIRHTPDKVKKAIRFNVFDSVIALNLAFFVNAAILILAASTFYKNGLFEIAEIQDAHKMLAPLLGNEFAPIFFAVALIASGQSSTITGTLAGQIVMEGYLNLRIQPWLRRLITRLIAIIPAFLIIYFFGEKMTGDMLVLSQVILSMQLGFATIPLIHFVSDKQKMGGFAINNTLKTLAWISATIIVSLNVKLVYEEIMAFIQAAGDRSWIIMLTVVPLALFALGLLLYITFNPFIRGFRSYKVGSTHPQKQPLLLDPQQPKYNRIAVAVDFSNMDSVAINHALAQGGKTAAYLLIHIVETAGAKILGREIKDLETQSDEQSLKEYAKDLNLAGYSCETEIGFGTPKKEIPRMVEQFNADILVMGGHGHQTLKDWVFGTTISQVRHRLRIPVLIVR
ncbi:MAG: Nramp family divalent metal transporter [Bacteroidetes bacterium]|nr:Nramp family divalent metal transporter [Bacteroidota bacterium]